MGSIDFDDLPEQPLLLIDSAQIICVLEDHPQFGPRFAPLFAAHPAGRLRFAVTTISVAEVLVGPLRAGDDALAQRYRTIFESWQPVALDLDIAASAARLRASLRLRLADALQAATHWRSTPPRLSPTTGIFPACARRGSFPDTSDHEAADAPASLPALTVLRRAADMCPYLAVAPYSTAWASGRAAARICMSICATKPSVAVASSRPKSASGKAASKSSSGTA